MESNVVKAKVFFISYDLTNSGNRFQDYKQIENLLLTAGAKRILINLWAYEAPLNTNSIDIRDELNQYIRSSDRLLVIEAVEWAWYLGSLVN